MDFTGTDPQARGAINSSLSQSISGRFSLCDPQDLVQWRNMAAYRHTRKPISMCVA
jgi:hypothetical protein